MRCTVVDFLSRFLRETPSKHFCAEKYFDTGKKYTENRFAGHNTRLQNPISHLSAPVPMIHRFVWGRAWRRRPKGSHGADAPDTVDGWVSGLKRWADDASNQWDCAVARDAAAVA